MCLHYTFYSAANKAHQWNIEPTISEFGMHTHHVAVGVADSKIPDLYNLWR